MISTAVSRQGIDNNKAGEKGAGNMGAGTNVIKAILKTKKASSTIRFDKIAAQCLGQAEAKKGRIKEEMVERLPL